MQTDILAQHPNPQQFPDVAELLGWQDDGCGGGFWLWNLTEPLLDRPIGSTLTERTIYRLASQVHGVFLVYQMTYDTDGHGPRMVIPSLERKECTLLEVMQLVATRNLLLEDGGDPWHYKQAI